MDRKYALYMRASFICAVYQHASESDIAIRLHSFWSLSFKLNVEIITHDCCVRRLPYALTYAMLIKLHIVQLSALQLILASLQQLKKRNRNS